MKICTALIVLLISSYGQVLGEAAIGTYPRDPGRAEQIYAHHDISPVESGAFDFVIELFPGQAFQSYIYYWAISGTADGDLQEETDVGWLSLSDQEFTSTGCDDVANVGYLFLAPGTPGVYTVAVEDLEGNWDDTNVTLIVTEDPASAQPVGVSAIVGETETYIDSDSYNGFDDLGCEGEPYFPGNTQTLIIYELNGVDWLSVSPAQFTLGMGETQEIEYTMYSEQPGNYTEYVIYEEEWFSWPEIMRVQFNVSKDTPQISVIQPTGSDVLVVGQLEDIRWNSTNIDDVNLFYATDYEDGIGNFQEIAFGVSAQAGEYEWEIPEELSRKCAVKIVDSNNPDIFSVSNVFSIKGFVLTRIDEDDDFLAYTSADDGWAFANNPDYLWPQSWYSQFDYANGIDPYTGESYPADWNSFPFNLSATTFPDWPLFVSAFGIDQCYFETDNDQLIYRPTAVSRWRTIAVPNWEGSCYGLATSSLLGFVHKDEFINHFGLADFAHLANVDTNSVVRNTINRLFLHQFGQDSYEQWIEYSNDAALTTLVNIKYYLAEETTQIPPLVYVDSNQSGAHSVTPFKITEDGADPSIEYIHVYDNNYPEVEKQILIDKNANAWAAEDGFGGQTGLYLDLELHEYFEEPGITPFAAKLASARSSRATGGDDRLDIFTSRGNSVGVYNLDDVSVISFNILDTTWTAGIPQARPQISRTGSVSVPFGYSVPPNPYLIELHNFLDSTASLTVDNGAISYTFGRYDASVEHIDKFGFDSGLEYVNEDGAEKTLNFEVLRQGDNRDQVVHVLNLEANSDAHFFLERLANGTVILENHGSGSPDYALRLHEASESGNRRFESSSIDLEGNSAHHIEPNWQDLNEPITILIDEGNDGVIDDSITIDNLVGIKHPAVGDIPMTIALNQNYPNPFNPSTVISYSIPANSHFSLNVYDTSGRLVRTLDSGRAVPGNYQIDWDGTNHTGQPTASGIYFYTLTVVSNDVREAPTRFIETKKMILLR